MEPYLSLVGQIGLSKQNADSDQGLHRLPLITHTIGQVCQQGLKLTFFMFWGFPRATFIELFIQNLEEACKEIKCLKTYGKHHKTLSF